MTYLFYDRNRTPCHAGDTVQDVVANLNGVHITGAIVRLMHIADGGGIVLRNSKDEEYERDAGDVVLWERISDPVDVPVQD